MMRYPTVLPAEMILLAVAAYLGCGLLFGFAFVVVRIERVDASARDTSMLFRLFILPGTMALWPFLAGKWWAARKTGITQ